MVANTIKVVHITCIKNCESLVIWYKNYLILCCLFENNNFQWGNFKIIRSTNCISGLAKFQNMNTFPPITFYCRLLLLTSNTVSTVNCRQPIHSSTRRNPLTCVVLVVLSHYPTCNSVLVMFTNKHSSDEPVTGLLVYWTSHHYMAIKFTIVEFIPPWNSYHFLKIIPLGNSPPSSVMCLRRKYRRMPHLEDLWGLWRCWHPMEGCYEILPEVKLPLGISPHQRITDLLRRRSVSISDLGVHRREGCYEILIIS